MSDRYDPKFPVRSPGDRGHAATSPAGDDPLAELARIVSGRSAFDLPPPKVERPPANAAPVAPAQMPFPAGPAPLPSEADLARDLEAELLNELQASFSTIPEIVGRPVMPPVVPAPAPPPAQMAPPQQAYAAPPQQAPSAPPPFLQAPPPMAARPPAPPQTAPMDVLEELGIPADMLFKPPGQANDGAVRPPQLAPMPPQQAPRMEQQIKPPPPAAKRESLASRIARASQIGGRDDGVQQLPVPQEPARVPVPQAPQRQVARAAPPVERGELPGGPFRPTLAPNSVPVMPAEPPKAAPTRWDAPVEARAPGGDLSRFAPPRAEPQERRETARREPPGDEPDFVEEFPFGDAPGFDAPASQAADMVPGYGDEEAVPYPDDDFAAYDQRRSSRRMPVLVAAVLGVVAIGSAAAIVFRPGAGVETPPIIAADTAPTKIAPEDTGEASGEGDAQGKLIYDRVDPGSDVADSQLVVSGDDPIADIPPVAEEPSNSPVSRVILGGGPGIDGPAGEAPMDLTGGEPRPVEGADAIGPKKVRTVVVRPDGTIVSSEAAESPEAATAPIPGVPPPEETPPAPAADENPLLAEDFGSPVSEVPPPAPPQPPVVGAPSPSPSIPDIPPPVATAPPPPMPRTPPTVVATTGSQNGPLDLTPGTAAPSPGAGSGGGFLVQVSSQRSEEVALSTFRDLQRRYPDILGSRIPDIQRADLGARGVYYRVRVGYPTRAAAVEMCESLKAAGGDCILATR